MCSQVMYCKHTLHAASIMIKGQSLYPIVPLSLVYPLRVSFVYLKKDHEGAISSAAAHHHPHNSMTTFRDGMTAFDVSCSDINQA